MPDWILLLPICFPMIGALILTPILSRVKPHAQQWLGIAFLFVEIALILLNAAPGTHRLIISNWETANWALVAQIDGVTLLILLTMFVPLVAIRLAAKATQNQHASFDPLTLLPLAAAILLALAGNLVTVYVAWALTDLAMLMWRLRRNIETESAVRGLVMGQLGGLALFAGIALLPSHPAEAASLVALALWARLGLFPFHWLLPTRGMDTNDLWFARGIPLLAASNLWLHWNAWQLDVPFRLIGILVGITLIEDMFALGREEHPARAVAIGASHAFALIPLAIAFDAEAGVAFALWLALAAGFALALFELAQRWQAENRMRWNHVIWCVGIITFAGTPLTPAFLGRIGVYVSLWERGEWFLLTLVGVTTLFILVPLWNFGFALRASETREPSRSEYAGLGLIAIAFGTLAFLPPLIAPALSPTMGIATERAIDRVIRTNDLVGIIIGAIVLLLPILGSLFLRILARNARPSSNSFFLRLVGIIDLGWLERVLTAIGFQAGATARISTMIAEENPTVWVLFVALWIAIFISIAR